MSTRPWYPRYPRDFRAKTAHLNLTERGAYDALLDHYYEIGAPLPADAAALYRIAGAHGKRERDAVDRVSGEFFTNGDGRLKQSRCDEEIARMDARSAQQAELANRRWSNAKAHAKASSVECQGIDAGISHGISQNDASHSHSHKEERSTPTRADKPRRTLLPPDFALSEKTLEWCKTRTIPVAELQARYDWFKDYAKSSGKQYADWQAAFKNSVRGNWAKLAPGAYGSIKLAI